MQIHQCEPLKIVLDRKAIILEQNIGETVSLEAKIYPANAADKSLSWYSSDPLVATVDSNGKVTSQKAGKTIITAETINGLKSSCIVYVMGFEVSFPAYCSLEENYEIKVDIFYNGEKGMPGRKRVLLEADDRMQLLRIGDENVSYNVLTESSPEYNGVYEGIHPGEYIVDTPDSATVYYRLMPEQKIKKAGDYEGNITFKVSVL